MVMGDDDDSGQVDEEPCHVSHSALLRNNQKILEAIVERIPHPIGEKDAPLQAMIFDSVFNSFRGIEAYFKIINGSRFQKL